MFDWTVRNQVLLESLKSEEVNQFAAFLKKIDQSVRQRLNEDELTDLNKARLTKLLSSVNGELKSIFDAYYDQLAGHLTDIADFQANFEVKNLASELSKGLDKGVPFETVIPAPTQVRASVFSTPLSVRGADGGKLLTPFVKDWASLERKKIVGAIRQGSFEGQTNSDIIRNIRGTKKNNYEDGVLATTSRNAGAIVRTSVQHVASVARFATWQSNGDLVKGYRWVSTLDSRTSSPCRSLDGQVFDLNKGPRPPIHINCRSTTIAELDKQFNFLKEGRTRASKDGPVEATKTYYQWLHDQPTNFQDEVLGPERGLLFRSGEISAEKFAKLNIGRNFKPLTLAEMRKKEPLVFQKAEAAKPLTKQAQKAVIQEQAQKQAIMGWVGGEDYYRSLVGSVDNPRIKKQIKEYNLTQSEAVALRHYTGTGYTDINKYLRGEKTETNLESAPEVLRAALDKLPSYKKETYRGTTLPDSVLKEHVVGSVVEYKAFTSTSHTEKVFDGDHLIIFKGKSGKKLGWISQYGDSEREVLFSSPSKFVVKNMDVDNDGILTIEVKEL